MRLHRTQYIEQVFDILETFDYPELIFAFSADDVADTIANTMYRMYIDGISPMMCAVIIWSMTMNYQILPSIDGQTIH